MRRTTPSLAGLFAVTVSILGIVAQPASATYPRAVGHVAFAIAGPEGNANICTALPDGRDLQRLTRDPFNDLCPAYSPDGRQITFCSDRTGTFEIWAMNANGSGQHAVTDLGGYAVFPDFSPSGRRIAFSGDEGVDPNDEIYTIDNHGGDLQQLTSTTGNNDYPAYSPNGRQIAFTSDRTGLEQVYIMNSDGSRQRQLTFDLQLHDELPDWSPDGTKIAYEDGESPNGRIFVMNANGNDQHPLHPGGKQYVPAWQALTWWR